MLNIALYEPEIPPNTGNIIRLCANAGAKLHLIHPLGFTLEDKQLKRAGLDYHEWASVKEHENFEAFLDHLSQSKQIPDNFLAQNFRDDINPRIFACTTKTDQLYTDVQYRDRDTFLFGPESRGLPDVVRNQLKETQIKIPMRTHQRSINLCNAVSIILYEALRQTDTALFP